MHYILDVVILIIIFLFAYSGFKRGLIKAGLTLISVIASAVLAALISNPVSTFIYDTFVKQGLRDRIAESLESTNINEVVNSLFDDFPGVITSLLESNGITRASVLSSASGGADSAADSVVTAISPGFISIINFFAVIVLFIAFVLLTGLLVSLISKSVRLPVLAQLDSILGSALGVVFAIIVSWLLISLVGFAAEFLPIDTSKAILDFITKSILGNILYSFNPFFWVF